MKQLLICVSDGPFSVLTEKGEKSSQRAMPFGNPCPYIYDRNMERPPELLPTRVSSLRSSR